jgi:hypothetical protein
MCSIFIGGVTNNSTICEDEGCSRSGTSLSLSLSLRELCEGKLEGWLLCCGPWRMCKGGLTHSMPRPCRSHAVPLPCRALIHTCRSAPLPCRVLRESPRGSRKCPNCTEMRVGLCIAADHFWYSCY